MDRRDARRKSLVERVRACADLVNANDEPWVVWCDLNAEGDALTAAIRGAVQIAGADDADVKERRLTDFAHGRIRVLVSKPSICGFGLNWQHCARMAFVGVTDSFGRITRPCGGAGGSASGVRWMCMCLPATRKAQWWRTYAGRSRTPGPWRKRWPRKPSPLCAPKCWGATRETNPYEPAALMRVPSWMEAA